MDGWNNTVDGRNPAQVDMVVYPILYSASYIPGGAGFLPSTAASFWDSLLFGVLLLLVSGRVMTPTNDQN